jgi:hypothetical protein
VFWPKTAQAASNTTETTALGAIRLTILHSRHVQLSILCSTLQLKLALSISIPRAITLSSAAYPGLRLGDRKGISVAVGAREKAVLLGYAPELSNS